MPKVPIHAGEVKVYTYKAGLLSRIAHDLQITVSGWTMELDGGQMVARFDAGSLKVDGAVKRGRLDPRGLKDKDIRTIEGTIRDEILQSGRNPAVVFEAEVSGSDKMPIFTGTLSLRGQSRPVKVQGRETAGRLEIDTEIMPSQWGIRPYEALMGAIKLQDRVRIRVRVEQWLDHVAAARGGDGHDHEHGHDHSH